MKKTIVYCDLCSQNKNIMYELKEGIPNDHGGYNYKKADVCETCFLALKVFLKPLSVFSHSMDNNV